MDMDDINPLFPFFRAGVGRTLDRARRRYLRARATPFSPADSPIAWGNGEIIQVPSGNEPITAERGSPLILPPPFDEIHSVHNPHHAALMSFTAPHVQTSKREGGPSNAPISKEARTSRDTEEPPVDVNLNENGIPSCNGNTLSLAVTLDDRAQAIRYPLLG